MSAVRLILLVFYTLHGVSTLSVRHTEVMEWTPDTKVLTFAMFESKFANRKYW